MSNNKLKAGDVVCLKSGGPRMTINSFVVRNEDEAECVWFHKSVEKQWLHADCRHYDVNTLKKCTTDEGNTTKCCKDK